MIERFGDTRARLAVDHFPDPDGSREIVHRLGVISSTLGGETEAKGSDRDLLVIGAKFADDQHQCLLGEHQGLAIFAGIEEFCGQLPRRLEFVGRLLRQCRRLAAKQAHRQTHGECQRA